MREDKTEARQRFDADFETLYQAKSPDSHSLFLYVQRLLHQFRLGKAYEVMDILVEVYARGVKCIENGTNIVNSQAWTKKVALNVIREFRRAADKIDYYDLESQPQLAATSADVLSELVFESDLEVVQKSFGQLSLKDKSILQLRIVNGFSWQQISTLLTQEGEEISENVLRQRGYRALQRLRANYEQMAVSYPSTTKEGASSSTEAATKKVKVKSLVDETY
ncbi:sigma-70 family RNA polymerase sigma factor [Phormidium tenue FACHB-886]|nr:sigma-70 family RNA polymerase sigma factor [Phormidium tenue FACHB-886]